MYYKKLKFSVKDPKQGLRKRKYSGIMEKATAPTVSENNTVADHRRLYITVFQGGVFP